MNFTQQAPPPHPLIHPGVRCSLCLQPVIGLRFQCQQCRDGDYCEQCYRYRTDDHNESHTVCVTKKPQQLQQFGTSLSQFGTQQQQHQQGINFGAIGSQQQSRGHWTMPPQHAVFAYDATTTTRWTPSASQNNNNNEMSVEGGGGIRAQF